MVIDYNRFLYAKGNPLKYTDPGGQEAYFFMSGFNPDPSAKKPTLFITACLAMLNEIKYSEDEHGPIYRAGNDPLTVLEIYIEILALMVGPNH